MYESSNMANVTLHM